MPQPQAYLHHLYSGRQDWGPWRTKWHALHMSASIYLILTDFRTMSKQFIKQKGKNSHTFIISLQKIKGRKCHYQLLRVKKRKAKIQPSEENNTVTSFYSETMDTRQFPVFSDIIISKNNWHLFNVYHTSRTAFRAGRDVKRLSWNSYIAGESVKWWSHLENRSSKS